MVFWHKLFKCMEFKFKKKLANVYHNCMKCRCVMLLFVYITFPLEGYTWAGLLRWGQSLKADRTKAATKPFLRSRNVLKDLFFFCGKDSFSFALQLLSLILYILYHFWMSTAVPDTTSQFLIVVFPSMIGQKEHKWLFAFKSCFRVISYSLVCP